jgi:uncharacterized protein (TIGR02453 family)
MAEASYFDAATVRFLEQLTRHNNHEWFRTHKAAYEEHVREPAQRLIIDLQVPLARVSPYFRADPRKVGGSLFRVMRDTRKKHPEGPYKPWIGLRFSHAQKNEVHAPSYYVHLSPDLTNAFVCGGIWKPEPPTLKKIRAFLDNNPNAWRQALASPKMKRYADDSEWLKSNPRGYPSDHPLIADLRRTSFVWTRPLHTFLSADLKQDIAHAFRDLAPVVDYLCAALDLPF